MNFHQGFFSFLAVVDIESATLNSMQTVLTAKVLPYFVSQPFLWFINSNHGTEYFISVQEENHKAKTLLFSLEKLPFFDSLINAYNRFLKFHLHPFPSVISLSLLPEHILFLPIFILFSRLFLWCTEFNEGCLHEHG